MILGLILTTIIAALSIVNPYISGVIVDDVIQAGNYDLLGILIACLLGVTLLNGVLRFVYQVWIILNQIIFLHIFHEFHTITMHIIQICSYFWIYI